MKHLTASLFALARVASVAALGIISYVPPAVADSYFQVRNPGDNSLECDSRVSDCSGYGFTFGAPGSFVWSVEMFDGGGGKIRGLSARGRLGQMGVLDNEFGAYNIVAVSDYSATRSFGRYKLMSDSLSEGTPVNLEYGSNSCDPPLVSIQAPFGGSGCAGIESYAPSSIGTVYDLTYTIRAVEGPHILPPGGFIGGGGWSTTGASHHFYGVGRTGPWSSPVKVEDLYFQAVPEPGTALLILPALAAIAYRRRHSVMMLWRTGPEPTRQ